MNVSSRRPALDFSWDFTFCPVRDFVTDRGILRFVPCGTGFFLPPKGGFRAVCPVRDGLDGGFKASLHPIPHMTTGTSRSVVR